MNLPNTPFRGVFLFVKKNGLVLFCSVFLFALIVLCLGKNAFLLILILLCFFFPQRGKAFLVIFLSVTVAIIIMQNEQKKLSIGIEQKEVQLIGYVKTQEVRSTYQQRLTIVVEESDESKIIGETLIGYAPRYPDTKKGTRVEVSCELTVPEPFDGFAYDRYLATQSIYVICRDISFLSQEELNLFSRKPLEFFRIQIAQRIESLWPRPQSSLVLGLLLGTRESFPSSTLTDFQRSGITHIIALSGFNITILIIFLELLAIQVLIPKRIRLWLIIAGILFFTVFVGAGASITRAAIMGSLVLLANYMARFSSPLRLMVITAAAMCLFNPFILLYDLGFQLSFLSTFGLLYLTNFFERLFFWVPQILSLRESLATTMAATITTLPLILYQFEQLSVISPIANMLILPIIPWLMAAGGVTVLLSFLHPSLATLFQWGVDLGCQYLLSASKLMASFSWSSLPIKLNFTWMVLSYAGIFLLILLTKKYEMDSQ